MFQDKDFGKQTLHKGHANPLAEVTTSLKTYQHFTLEKAYLGEDFFWAFTPVAGDFIRIRFFTPVRIERLVPTPNIGDSPDTDVSVFQRMVSDKGVTRCEGNQLIQITYVFSGVPQEYNGFY